MKTIISSNNLINNILGEQTKKDNVKYRCLTFCLPLSRDDKFIVYNFLTKELVEFKADEFFAYINNNFIDETFKNELIKKWFLVPEYNDDIKLNEQVINTIKMLQPPKKLNFYTVLPTTDCNARCFYCYEAGVKKIVMSHETSHDVADYIMKNSNKESKITFRWFGGEPLYNADAIDIITNKLNENGYDFESTMVSNAYLFDDNLVERAKNTWNLKHVQVTLDGTEEIYNRCKNYIYKDGKSAYLKVIDNIRKLIVNEIRVIVRLNMDWHNKADLYVLLDYLHENFGNNKFCSVYLHLLYENSGNMTIDYTEQRHDELVQEFFKLEDYAMSLGFSLRGKFITEPKLNCCMADNDSSIVILPDGKLSKCEHALEKDIIGTIYSENHDKDIIASWKERAPISEQCKNCVIFPDCIPLKKCATRGVGCHKSQQLDFLRSRERMIWHAYDKNCEN